MEVITVQLFKSYFIATSFLLISYAVSLPQFQQSPPSGRLSASTGREQQSRQQMRSPSGSEWAFDSINPMLAGSQSNSGSSTHGVRSNRTVQPNMAQSLIAQPTSLDVTSGNVSVNLKVFQRKFQLYLTANNLGDAKDEVKTALLHSFIGDDANDLIESLGLTDKPVKDIFEGLNRHCSPKTNVIIEQFKFFQYMQKEGETFDHFLLTLKRLIRNCEFKDQADNLLKVRIVLGLHDRALQERLLRDPEVGLDKVIQFCRAAEAAQENHQIVMSGLNSDNRIEMAAVTQKQSQQTERWKTPGKQITSPVGLPYDCKKCGRKHQPRACPAYGKKCNRCGLLGHFVVGCRKAMTAVGTVDLNVVSANTDEPWREYLKFQGCNVKFKLDSGADINTLPYSLYKKMLKYYMPVPTLEKANVVASAYGGSSIKIVGKVKLTFDCKGCTISSDFFVIDDTTPSDGLKSIEPLLSRSTCVRLGEDVFVGYVT